MDQELLAAGTRIRDSMSPGMSQRELAESVGMTPDALSRALNGQRGFSSRELTKIAENLRTDLTWLITGQPNPHGMRLAARHLWDVQRRQHTNPGQDDDENALQKVRALYQDAYPDSPPASAALPKDPAEIRSRLGADFILTFAERVELELGIDVMRIPEIKTAYSLTIGERSVIVLPVTPNWFYNNWSLAHELGHLALGHQSDSDSPVANPAESEANGFAADILLPIELLNAQDWTEMTKQQLAAFVWRTGVSTPALRIRLEAQQLQPSSVILLALDHTTPSLLSGFGQNISGVMLADRRQKAATRRFPPSLLSSLTAGVESGRVSPDALAWALGVLVDEIEIEFPQLSSPAAARDYDRAMADRPSLGALLEGSPIR